MFEEAVRKKYRFPSRVGSLNVEDLWDLSVENLDIVYKTLNREVKQVEEESLLDKSDQNQEVKNKIAIVKHIYAVKINDQNDRLMSKERAEKKQYLLSILQQKQSEVDKSKSIDELQKLIAEL